MKVYLDNAATTAVDPEVVAEMLPYFTKYYGNASSIHSYGRPVRAAIEKSRKTVAGVLNASTAEVFFTSCGTEANNMAIKSGVRSLGVKHFISTPVEHHCVLYAVQEACKGADTPELHLLRMQSTGEIDYDHLEELLSGLDGKVMVSVMHANNEIGTMNDIERIGSICKAAGAYFHSDTVQTVGHYPIDVQACGIHFLSGSAHKFHGPKGVGFCYIDADINIDPYIHGGSQERNMRAGTENVAGIIGLGKALELSVEKMEEESRHIAGLREYMARQLREQVPGVEFNTPLEGARTLCRVLSVSFPPSERNEMLLFNLDINGIAASGGSACSSGATAGSHVLAALDKDAARAAVRFSFNGENTTEEIDYVVGKVVESLRIPAARVKSA